MVYSFNDSKAGTTWTGFTFQWYVDLVSNVQIMNALKNSLFVAFVTTILACTFGTMTALAIYKYNFPGKKLLDILIYIPVVIPDIVLAVALLAIYGGLQVTLGTTTVIPGHVAISISFAIFVILSRLARYDRSIEDAAKDLGANEWQTFWRVTFPLIFPGILASALLVFTISLDDFNIAYFNTGPGSSTLPVLVFSMVRRGVSPEINALSTIMILVIVIMVLLIGRSLFSNTKKS